MADPLPIVKMFWLDEELHSDLILDGRKTKVFFNTIQTIVIVCIGLITVIDAHNGLKVNRKDKHFYRIIHIEL